MSGSSSSSTNHHTSEAEPAPGSAVVCQLVVKEGGGKEGGGPALKHALAVGLNRKALREGVARDEEREILDMVVSDWHERVTEQASQGHPATNMTLTPYCSIGLTASGDDKEGAKVYEPIASVNTWYFTNGNCVHLLRAWHMVFKSVSFLDGHISKTIQGFVSRNACIAYLPCICLEDDGDITQNWFAAGDVVGLFSGQGACDPRDEMVVIGFFFSLGKHNNDGGFTRLTGKMFVVFNNYNLC